MVNSGKPVILTVISVLVVMLIYSSSSPVLAESPRDICTGILVDSASKCNCNYYENQKTGARITSCCTKTLDGKDLCKVCDVGPPPQGEYSNCHISNKPTKGLANPPQGGVIEQPSTPKKHGGTTLPKGGGLEQP